MERKDDKSFKRDIIGLISFPILFVSTSFLVNIGKEMSLPGFRTRLRSASVFHSFNSVALIEMLFEHVYRGMDDPQGQIKF